MGTWGRRPRDLGFLPSLLVTQCWGGMDSAGPAERSRAPLPPSGPTGPIYNCCSTSRHKSQRQGKDQGLTLFLSCQEPLLLWVPLLCPDAHYGEL